MDPKTQQPPIKSEQAAPVELAPAAPAASGSVASQSTTPLSASTGSEPTSKPETDPIKSDQAPTGAPAGPTESSSLPPKPRKKFPFLKILLVLLGLIIVGGLVAGAYWFGSKNNSMKNVSQSIPTPTPEPTSPPTPTPDITITWKTYANATNTLSIKYPSDWTYDTALLKTLKMVAFGPGNYKIPLQTEASPPIALTVKGEKYETVLKRYVDFWGSQTQKDITIASMSGVFISGTNTAPGPGQGHSGGVYILNDNGSGIEFFYNVIAGVDYKSTADKMIQTLQVK